MVSDRDRRQVEALKALGRRWSADPVQLRLVLAVVVLGIGLGVVERPLAARLASARSAHTDALKQSRMAEDHRFLATQAAGYEKRVAVSTDLVDWQNYVLDRLRTTSATMVSLEPKSTLQKPPFDVIEMELVCRGNDFNAFVDLIDRLEHGERLVRIEKLRIERQQTTVTVTMIIKGLARASGKAVAKADKGGKPAKGAKPAAGGKDAAAAAPTESQEAAPESGAETAVEPQAAPADESEPVPDAAPESGDGGDDG